MFYVSSFSQYVYYIIETIKVASRTLWFGRIPPLSSEKDICDAVKEAGIPEKVLDNINNFMSVLLFIDNNYWFERMCICGMELAFRL
jgi:hypothetical protein